MCFLSGRTFDKTSSSQGIRIQSVSHVSTSIRCIRSLLFRVDARGTDSLYFYPSLFFHLLSLSVQYFIVSRALRPLKRLDYKRPINSFILFAHPPPPALPFPPAAENRASLFPTTVVFSSLPFFSPFLVHPRHFLTLYLFHRCVSVAVIVVNWPSSRRKKEKTK